MRRRIAETRLCGQTREMSSVSVWRHGGSFASLSFGFFVLPSCVCVCPCECSRERTACMWQSPHIYIVTEFHLHQREFRHKVWRANITLHSFLGGSQLIISAINNRAGIRSKTRDRQLSVTTVEGRGSRSRIYATGTTNIFCLFIIYREQVGSWNCSLDPELLR